MGLIFGALGGLMIALAFAKFENHQQFRWTIKLVCFGVGIGLFAENQGMLGVMIANVLIFGLVFGVVGVIVDLVKNRSGENEKPPSIDKTKQGKDNSSSVSTPEIKLSNSESSTHQNNSARKVETDENIWAFALEEFESKSRIKGLYAKLYTQNDGNEQRIKSQYIKERFEQLKKEQKEIQAAEDARAKEKFELFQKQQLEKKIKESALERTINGKTNLVKTIRGIDCYVYEDGRVAIKVEEHRYRLYVDLETAEESINYFKQGNKNYFDEEMRYLPNGFIGWITIDNDKKIISCPRCSQKTRVPSNKELEITCPSCKFQWRERT